MESKRLERSKQMVDEYFELDAMDNLDEAEMGRRGLHNRV